MITEDIFNDELLQQVAAELATAINDSLPIPNECQHKFSDDFERKMQSLIGGMSTKCYAIAIQDCSIHK